MDPIARSYDTFQEFTERTALYPRELAMPYLGLGLCDEAVEVLDAVEAAGNSRDWTQHRKIILAEVGDVCWYFAQLLLRRGIPLSRLYQSLDVEQFPATLQGVTFEIIRCAGAIAGRLKKEIRDNKMDEAKFLHYAARLLHALECLSRVCGSNLTMVMAENQTKLLSRLERNVIKGEGDVR